MDKCGKPTTIDEIRALDKAMLVPKDIAGYLGCTPYSINIQAQIDMKKLGFPVTVMGSRVKIPKDGFIAWAEGRVPVVAEKATGRRCYSSREGVFELVD